MTSEADYIRDLTTRYLSPPGELTSSRRVSVRSIESRDCESERELMTPDSLISLSQSARELLDMPVPSPATATRSASLFEFAGDALWLSDEFGERYEVCALFAFVSWRNAAACGLERESQEWLRIVDRMVAEEAVAFECLSTFLYLRDDAVTPNLESHFLEKPEDIFLALSILRRDRYRRPNAVIAAATGVYRRLEKRGPRAIEGETQFFLGEAALIAGGLERIRGHRRTASKWLEAALAHFAFCPASEPLIAKAKLTLAVLARDVHEYEESKRWRAGLLDRFVSWGMAKEAGTLVLVEALILKDRGATGEARLKLTRLAAELRLTSERSLLAAVLGPLGQLECDAGERDSGLRLLHEALELSTGNGDLHTTSSMCMMLGECEAARGEQSRSIRWFEAALAAAESAECSLQLAYFRVFVADQFLALSMKDEARALLMLAIPLLRDGEMIPESIHAIKLLQTIDGIRSSRCVDRPQAK